MRSMIFQSNRESSAPAPISAPAGAPSPHPPWATSSPLSTPPTAPGSKPKQPHLRGPSRERRRSRGCGPDCPICSLRHSARASHRRYSDSDSLSLSLQYGSLPFLLAGIDVPRATPTAFPHPPPPARVLSPLDPSSIYTLVYPDSPGLYSLALYFTRSTPLKPGYLCRGTLGHPSCPRGVTYHQRKCALSTHAQTRTLLAALRIGSLDGAAGAGEKVLRRLRGIRLEHVDVRALDAQYALVVWWRAALRVMFDRGYVDCEGDGLELDKVQEEAIGLAREQAWAECFVPWEEKRVGVAESQFFL